MRRLRPFVVLILTFCAMLQEVCHAAKAVRDITRDFDAGMDALKASVDGLSNNGDDDAMRDAFSDQKIQDSKEKFREFVKSSLALKTPLKFSKKTYTSRQEKIAALKEVSRNLKNGMNDVASSENSKLEELFSNMQKLDKTKIVQQLLLAVMGAIPSPWGPLAGGAIKLFTTLFSAAKPETNEYNKMKTDLLNQIQDMFDAKYHEDVSANIGQMIDVMDMIDNHPDSEWTQDTYSTNVQNPAVMNKLLITLHDKFIAYTDKNTFLDGRRALKCACSYVELARQRDIFWTKLIGKMSISPGIADTEQENIENWQTDERREWTFLNIFNVDEWWDNKVPWMDQINGGKKYFSIMFAYNLPAKKYFTCASNIHNFLKEVRSNAEKSPSDYSTQIPPARKPPVPPGIGEPPDSGTPTHSLATYWLRDGSWTSYDGNTYPRLYLGRSRKRMGEQIQLLEALPYTAHGPERGKNFRGNFMMVHVDTNRYRIVMKDCIHPGSYCYFVCGWIQETGWDKNKQASFKCHFRNNNVPRSKDDATLFTVFKAGHFRGDDVLMLGPSYPDALPGRPRHGDPEYKYQYILGGSAFGDDCTLQSDYYCSAGFIGYALGDSILQQDRNNKDFDQYDESNMYWGGTGNNDYLQSYLWRWTTQERKTKSD